MGSVVAKTGLGKVGGTIFICTISSQTGKFRTNVLRNDDRKKRKEFGQEWNTLQVK